MVEIRRITSQSVSDELRKEKRKSVKTKNTLSALVAAQPAAKKLKQLRLREAERLKRVQVQVESWFDQFDENGDGRLQRDELRALLTWIHPSRPPTEENLDYLIQKATAVVSSSLKIPGNKHGSVGWYEIRATVLQYGDYVKDQKYIDSIFRRYDVDENGTLDKDELLELLTAVAPEGCEADEMDVEFVMEHFDRDKDGNIARDELLPMLGKWAQIAFNKIELREESLRPRRLGEVFKEAAEQAGTVVIGAGDRLLSIAQLARQQQKRDVAMTRWTRAGVEVGISGEAVVPGSPLRRIVDAAVEQRAQDDLHQQKVSERQRLSERGEEQEEPQKEQPKEEQKEEAEAAPEASLVEASVVGPMLAPHATPQAPPPLLLQRVHSRNDAASRMDRDHEWAPEDHINSWRNQRELTRRASSVRAAIHDHAAAKAAAAAPEEELPSTVSPQPPGEKSSFCVIQ